MGNAGAGTLKERVGGIDPWALVGSGCLWAWFDAGFMGSFSVGPGLDAFSSEVVSLVGSLAQLALCVVLLARSRRFARLVTGRRFVVAVGAVGTVASLGVTASGWLGSLPLALAAQLLRSAFVAFALAAWGGLYCRDGSRSALTYVAGGFALALPIDVLLLVMVPPVPAFAFSVLPLVSSLLLAHVDEDRRAYPQRPAGVPAFAPVPAAADVPSAPRIRRARAGLSRYLGISSVTVCGLALVMVGFGYTQCQVSLEASLDGALVNGPVVIQLVRGAVSVVLFALVLLAPRGMGAVSRAGLLVFIGGFSLMPFVYPTDLLWTAGMAVLCGYTVVDVLIWVVTAQAAVIRSADALRTVCIMRLLINCVCQALGRIVGVAVVEVLPDGLVMPVVSLFGYLMTAGVVLLLSGRDIWELFHAEPPVRPAVPAGEGQVQVVARLAEEHGLTQREREVFAHLAQGRSKPWVAKALGISDSTVNTHVRSLYEKLGVTNRQDLLDLVVCGQSTDSNEGARPLG